MLSLDINTFCPWMSKDTSEIKKYKNLIVQKDKSSCDVLPFSQYLSLFIKVDVYKKVHAHTL